MRSILVLASAAMLSPGAHAQASQPGQDHAAHHAQGASAPASGPKKVSARARTSAAAPLAAAPAASSASGGMGMDGADMKQMHDEMHKSGGMHDKMHGKDGQPMKGPMKAMGTDPAASH